MPTKPCLCLSCLGGLNLWVVGFGGGEGMGWVVCAHMASLPFSFPLLPYSSPVVVGRKRKKKSFY